MNTTPLEQLKTRVAGLISTRTTPEEAEELRGLLSALEDELSSLKFKYERTNKDKLISNALLRHTSDDLIKAWQEAEESRTKYHEVVRGLREVVFTLDDAERITFLNPAWTQITGLSIEDCLQHPMIEFLHEGDRASYTASIDSLRRQCEGKTITVRGRHCDGTWRWLELSLGLVSHEKKPVTFAGTINDITGRKLAEEALRLTQFAVDRTADSVLRMTPEGQFTYVNEAACRSLGYSRQELLTMRVPDIDPNYSVQKWPAHWSALKNAGTRIFESVHRTKAGVQFPVEVRANYINFDGQEYHYSFVRDISERKHAETQLRQAQKMEAVGQLAGGVAHDFNNIMAAILMQLGLLEENPKLTADVRSALNEMEKGANRAASLTQQLLMFSRRQVAQVKTLDLCEIIAETVKLLTRILGEHIEVAIRGSADPMWIEADAGMIQQVVMNLCVNARDAMPNGGRITIGTQRIAIEGASAQSGIKSKHGSFVCLSVADTGCGIPPEVQPRIFEPFFTTKEVGRGTGLGLATVYGIIKQQHGWIEVESELNTGTVFRVFLPACETPESRNSERAPGQPLHGKETILVVEDDDALRTVVVLCLERLGYEVLAAANGSLAIEQANLHERAISLLLTDMVMPGGMSGLELARQLMPADPRLKVIVSSGYSPELTKLEAELEDGITLFPKPYDMSSLSAAIRNRLDEKL